MASIISPVAKLDSLIIEGLPTGRSVDVTKAAQCQGFLIVLGANGRLYTMRREAKYAYSAGDWPWMDSLMKTLLKWGIITKPQMQQHLEWNRQCYERQRARDATRQILYYTDKLGIKLTKSQQEQLKRLSQ